jgi:hypothetical protein
MGCAPYLASPSVKPVARGADAKDVTTSRSLSLLSSLASFVFMAAAAAAWLLELWPANPTTLGLAAMAVVSGPLLGAAHVATAQERRPPATAPEIAVAVVPQAPLTQAAASARAFHNWRESVHPAIERRERERRASRWIRA